MYQIVMLVLFVIGYFAYYANEHEMKVAQWKALQESEFPLACKQYVDLRWTEWMSVPDEEIRNEQCRQFRAMRNTYQVWPNPFLVLVEYTVTILITPMIVCIEVLSGVYFHLLVQLGLRFTLILLLFLALLVYWMLRTIFNTYVNASHRYGQIRPIIYKGASTYIEEDYNTRRILPLETVVTISDASNSNYTNTRKRNNNNNVELIESV
jgi:hypothetical protein